jgi:hypothetical protein
MLEILNLLSWIILALGLVFVIQMTRVIISIERHGKIIWGKK